MKKIIFTLTVLTVLSLFAQPSFSASCTNNPYSISPGYGENKKAIVLGSNRKSGEMLVRFTAKKAGEASITILNEEGKIVLQQTNQLNSSYNAIPLKNATNLPDGSYTVQMIANNVIFKARFMILR